MWAAEAAASGKGAGLPWRPLRRWPPGAVPPWLRPWLAAGDSLSRRLARLCPGGLRVRLLDQGWRRPLPGERRALGLASGRLAWVRVVELGCGGEVWVRARTVIPRATWRAARARLAGLGERPLGSRLFPGGRRLQVEAAPVGRRGDGGLWARRSLLLLAGRPLLVTELFLPALAAAGGAGAAEAPEAGRLRRSA